MPKPLPRWDTSIDDLQPFANVSLVVADFDGTLHRSAGDELSELIKRLRRSLGAPYGVRLTIATGRTLSGIYPFVQQLELPRGIPLILYNGSIVLRNTTFEILYQRTLVRQALPEILEITRQCDSQTLAYYCNDPIQDFHLSMNALRPDEFVMGWTRGDRPVRDFNGMEIRWMSFQSTTPSTDPTAILIKPLNIRGTSEKLLEALECVKGIDTTRSGDEFIEIRPTGSNKGIALSQVASELGCDREHILAIGDNDNDAEMLHYAGIGVAIKGASQNALEKSDFVCNHGSVRGAIQTFRLVKEARRYFGGKISD